METEIHTYTGERDKEEEMSFGDQFFKWLYISVKDINIYNLNKKICQLLNVIDILINKLLDCRVQKIYINRHAILCQTLTVECCRPFYIPYLKMDELKVQMNTKYKWI